VEKLTNKPLYRISYSTTNFGKSHNFYSKKSQSLALRTISNLTKFTSIKICG